MPCPVMAPGVESPTYVYTGHPFTVSCLVPSLRLSTPSLADTPAPAVAIDAGAGTGGQYVRQLPVQLECPCESAPKTYRAMPWPFTRIVPTGVEAVPTTPPDAVDAGGVVPAAPGLLPPPLELPHAASRNPAAIAPTAVNQYRSRETRLTAIAAFRTT